MRLNLGANDRRVDGFVSVDICEPADQIVDLRQDWPWGDSTVEEVLAFDVFEHIKDKRHTMNELWRVLVPGGIARIQVPHGTDGDGGICDPTHESLWSTSDFEYYHPGIAEYDRFHTSPYYGIRSAFRVLSMTKTRHERNWGGYVMEINAVIEAVK